VAATGPTAMNLIETQKEIARLDGFLYGAALMIGNTRRYSACAYLIEAKDDVGIEQALRDFYYWRPGWVFDGVERFERGTRDLEIGMRPFIARQTSQTNDVDLSNLQAYLSFKAMDMISLILDGRTGSEVFRLNSVPEPATSDGVFFLHQGGCGVGGAAVQ
jgi:hypothetical protein